MRIPKTCGKKPKGRSCEGFPFEGSITELDERATASLRGEGKNKMTPTYGATLWNGRPRA